MFEIFKKKPAKPAKKNIFKEEELPSYPYPREFPRGSVLPASESARRGGFYDPFSLAASTYDYEMSAGRLQHEMQAIAGRNELFTTTRKVIDDFQRNVFSNISEGEMNIKMSIVCRPGGPATISFQLFIGYAEKLMEEKVEYPLSRSNVRQDIDEMITRLMTKVLASLAYTAMYKVIEKVDTL